MKSLKIKGIIKRGVGGAGDVLLSRGLSRSTISAEAFHGRVRNGIGCCVLAIVTSHSNPPVSLVALEGLCLEILNPLLSHLMCLYL